MTFNILEILIDNLLIPIPNSNDVKMVSPAISPHTLTGIPTFSADSEESFINRKTERCAGSYIFDGTQSELRTIPPRQPHIDSFQYIWEIDDLIGYYDMIEDYEFAPHEDSTLYQYTSFPDPALIFSM